MSMTEREPKTKGLIFFSDFDGTISTRDVGNRLFNHFSHGKSDEPVARWRADRIDSRQCLLEEVMLIDDLTEEELFEFVDGFEIDPGFGEFVELCRSYSIPLYILSDGLDIYITRLLAKYRLNGVPVLANRARLDHGRLTITWPWLDGSCGFCGNCKGYHIRRLRKPGQKALYIGDGKSDLCAVEAADLIFAKDFLAEYCSRQEIEYLPFDGFSTITKILKTKFV